MSTPLPPQEIGPPDIRRWAAGNAGIPYLWTFAAPAPGPHVMLAAIVHGNEPSGAIVLDRLLADGLRPTVGRLTMVFMNYRAQDRFDPADPFAARWVEEDLNRVWDQAVLEGPRRSVELDRAREVRPVLDTVDLLLDLHSMSNPAEPLTLAGPLARGAALARRLGHPRLIVADHGHAAGRRMRDYGRFAAPDGEATALLVECGQHWARSSLAVAATATARFLALAGQAPAAPAPPDEPAPLLVEVTEVVTVRREPFVFTSAFVGGETIPAKGTVIALEAGQPVVTTHDDCVLIMPTRRLGVGLTAVRFGRIVRD